MAEAAHNTAGPQVVTAPAQPVVAPSGPGLLDTGSAGGVAMLLALQRTAGNAAVCALMAERHAGAGGRPRLFRNGPHGGADGGPAGFTPLVARGATLDEAAQDATLQLVAAGAPPHALLVTDGRIARFYDAGGRPITQTMRLIAGRVNVTAAGVGLPGPDGKLHPLVRLANGRIVTQNRMVIPGTGSLGTAFTPSDLEAAQRALTGRGQVVHVLPERVASAPEPEADHDEVPEFFRPTHATPAAGLPAYPAQLTPLTPLATSVGSTGSFQMHVIKTAGAQGLLDATTNVMQPTTFRWEVIRLQPNDAAQDRYGALIDAYRNRDAGADHTVGRGEGVGAGYRRRYTHAVEDTQTLLGDHPEQQGIAERALRELGASMLTGPRLALGMAGESALTVVRAVLSPGQANVDDIIDIPFRQEGLHLIRGFATPDRGTDRAHTRATSIVGTFVDVRDIVALARNALPSTDQQRTAFDAEATAQDARVRELRAQLEAGVGSEAEDASLRRAIAEAEAQAGYARARSAAAGDTQRTLEVDRADLQRRLAGLADRPASDPQVRELREQVAALDARLGRIRDATATRDQFTAVTSMDAVLIDEASGASSELVFTVTRRRRVTQSDLEVEIADVTADTGRTASGSGPDVAGAWAAALRDLRRNLGRGRGMLAWRAPGEYAQLTVDVPNPMRLQMGAADQAVELLDDASNAATLAALVAAPFTAGASLAILAPLGAVGAVTSAYRLVDRTAYGDLHLDLASISDALNIVSFGAGRLGQAGRFATRAQLVFSEGKVGARMLEAGGFIVMAAQQYQAFTAPDTSLDPRADQERRLLAFLQFVQAAGVTVAPHMWPQGHGGPAGHDDHTPAAGDDHAPGPRNDGSTPSHDESPSATGGEHAAPASGQGAAGSAPELARALGPGLEHVPVTRDRSLHPSGSVRVEYTMVLGIVTDIHVRAGATATIGDIQAHAATVAAMDRYRGLSGLLRDLYARVRAWRAGTEPPPPVGSRAWEAMFEVEKLPRIIEGRLRELQAASGTAAVDAAADVEALRAQLEDHRRTLEALDRERGRGFVAAESGAHRDAAQAGYPPLEQAPGHYYEHLENGEFALRQRADSNDPPKRLERDSAGRLRIVDAGGQASELAGLGLTTQELDRLMRAGLTAAQIRELHEQLGLQMLRRATTKRPDQVQQLARVQARLADVTGDPAAAKGLQRLGEGAGAVNAFTRAELLDPIPPEHLADFLRLVGDDTFTPEPGRLQEPQRRVLRDPNVLALLARADGPSTWFALRLADHHPILLELARQVAAHPEQADALISAVTGAQTPGRQRRVLDMPSPPRPPRAPRATGTTVAPDTEDPQWSSPNGHVARARKFADEHPAWVNAAAQREPPRSRDEIIESLATLYQASARGPRGYYEDYTHDQRLAVLVDFDRVAGEACLRGNFQGVANNLRGALSESLFQPAGSRRHVRLPNPGIELPGAPGAAPVRVGAGTTIVDYEFAEAQRVIPGVRNFVEQKSDLLGLPGGTTASRAGRDAARLYLDHMRQDRPAISQVPGGAVLLMEFVRRPPNEATRREMLEILFTDGDTGFQAVRFADEPWVTLAQWRATRPAATTAP